MTGYNHAATGMLIGAALPFPLSIPVAIVSHFALDTLPHYGIPQKHRDVSKFWRVFFIIDFFVAWGLGIFALIHHQPALFWAGLAACSPDFFWVGRILKTRSFDLSRNETRFTQWHAGIQRFERPWGLWVELPFSVLMSCLVGWIILN
jgi:hypothetical protein